ncbi:hypothetical protein AE618_17090 [Bosea vaviloviae]|uniref:Glycosyltransferase 2-like domain-containing protein n=2 Tax=Bosea vaviloviae TaxID=1526658 RepID=A0A0N0MB95_9HYPH|nr:hypothetical protein AE618_17090 [Bosea vaviloviae]
MKAVVMSKAPPLYFAVPVWGDSYVETYLNVCLPAQLSSGNIQSLSTDSRNEYHIYTAEADAKRIEDSVAYRALCDLISVSIHVIDVGGSTASGGEKYAIKSESYRDALNGAISAGAAVVALNADIVMADGFVRTIVGLLARGIRVIEIPGPRALKQEVVDILLKDFKSSDNGILTVSPNELSRIWFGNRHPQLLMHCVEGIKGDEFHPSHLYWIVEGSGVIIRGFHLYPIVVYPKNKDFEFAGTIDDDLVASLNLGDHERFLAQDSRELFCCELSVPEHFVGRMADRGDINRYVEYYRSYAAANMANLQKEIIISADRPTSFTWLKQRWKSRRFAARLARLYERAAETVR